MSSFLEDLILGPKQQITFNQTAEQTQAVEVNPAITVEVDLSELENLIADQTNLLKLNSVVLLKQAEAKPQEKIKVNYLGAAGIAAGALLIWYYMK